MSATALSRFSRRYEDVDAASADLMRSLREMAAGVRGAAEGARRTALEPSHNAASESARRSALRDVENVRYKSLQRRRARKAPQLAAGGAPVAPAHSN